MDKQLIGYMRGTAVEGLVTVDSAFNMAIDPAALAVDGVYNVLIGGSGGVAESNMIAEIEVEQAPAASALISGNIVSGTDVAKTLVFADDEGTTVDPAGFAVAIYRVSSSLPAAAAP